MVECMVRDDSNGVIPGKKDNLPGVLSQQKISGEIHWNVI